MVTGRKLACQSLFIALAFQNVLHSWNADGFVKSGDDPCASDINLMGF